MSNAFEMSTSTTIVLLGSLRWLKPVTTLAEMGSRTEVEECLGLKPCWERRVPRAFTAVGRSLSKIFAHGLSSEIQKLGGRCGLVDAAPLLSGW